jgi:hypothetical protein
MGLVYGAVERRATRMRQMMNRLNTDPGTLVRLRGGAAFAEARENCLRCAGTSECLRWLDGYGAEDESPDFCPNLALFYLAGRGRRRLKLA